LLCIYIVFANFYTWKVELCWMGVVVTMVQRVESFVTGEGLGCEREGEGEEGEDEEGEGEVHC